MKPAGQYLLLSLGETLASLLKRSCNCTWLSSYFNSRSWTTSKLATGNTTILCAYQKADPMVNPNRSRATFNGLDTPIQDLDAQVETSNVGESMGVLAQVQQSVVFKDGTKKSKKEAKRNGTKRSAIPKLLTWRLVSRFIVGSKSRWEEPISDFNSRFFASRWYSDLFESEYEKSDIGGIHSMRCKWLRSDENVGFILAFVSRVKSRRRFWIVLSLLWWIHRSHTWTRI